MSRLIETIRVTDGRPLNMDYHVKRITESTKAVFGGLTPGWQFGGMFGACKHGTYKLRLSYNNSEVAATITPYTIRPVRSLKLVFNDNIMYDHKYEDRSVLQEMFNRREDCDDVLIVKNNLITDITYANIIFKKDDEWFTPDSYLLNGTMRQYLLDNKKIFEARITPDDLSKYSHFKLINAMLRDEAPESEVLNIR